MLRTRYHASRTQQECLGRLGITRGHLAHPGTSSYLPGKEHSALSLMETCVRDSLMFVPEDGWSMPASLCLSWLASAASLRFCTPFRPLRNVSIDDDARSMMLSRGAAPGAQEQTTQVLCKFQVWCIWRGSTGGVGGEAHHGGQHTRARER